MSALDQRDHRESDHPAEGACAADDPGAELDARVDARGFDRYSPCGHAPGGRNATAHRARYPEPVLCVLVNVSPQAWTTGSGEPAKQPPDGWQPLLEWVERSIDYCRDGSRFTPEQPRRRSAEAQPWAVEPEFLAAASRFCAARGG